MNNRYLYNQKETFNTYKEYASSYLLKVSSLLKVALPGLTTEIVDNTLQLLPFDYMLIIFRINIYVKLIIFCAQRYNNLLYSTVLIFCTQWSMIYHSQLLYYFTLLNVFSIIKIIKIKNNTRKMGRIFKEVIPDIHPSKEGINVAPQ